MFGLFTRQRFVARGPSGHRAYVVGDVHGRLDLLEELLAEIERDVRASAPGKALLVFLGDLIDRGPNSASVVELLRLYRYPPLESVFLLGNHEEVLLRILGGEAQLIADWRLFGGGETLMSYGVEPEALAGLDQAGALAAVRKAIPPQHVAFLRSFADTCRFGDYLFVHAGIRPGIDLDQQKQADLRWIREPFLNDGADHGFIVVHGHTISNEVEERSNRIGIDTGAYKTGVLTALVVDGEHRRFLTTAANDPSMAPPAH
jgi:diadenosine tetraphosphatase ApaH/serine/threonine PP2A family protein phosphatase